MNDDFLHRLRVRPPPKFLARLKSGLDREPLRPRVSLAHAVLAAFLAGASAWALASFALRGELTAFGLHWSGSGSVLRGSDAAEPPVPPAAGSVSPSGWPRNPWAPARRDALPARAQKRGVGSSADSVVPIPGSVVAAPHATTAQYNSLTAPPAPGGGEHLRIGVTLHAEDYPDRIVKSFVKAGYTPPQVSVEPVGALLGRLCAEDSIDLASVTRRMTPTEASACSRRNLPQVEIKYAYQAVALVRSKLYGALALSARDIYLALAKEVPDPANPAVAIRNPYSSWNEVNPTLPGDPIQVLGPAAKSEPGQVFITLLVEAGCSRSPPAAAVKSPAGYESLCRTLRDDGVYADLPETGLDQKLQTQPTVLAVVPYSMWQLRGGALAASPIEGVVPSQQSIQSGSYPGSRTMYLYVNQHQARRLSTLAAFLVDFLKPLDNDSRDDVTLSLGRAERGAILYSTFNALGYPPISGEQR